MENKKEVSCLTLSVEEIGELLGICRSAAYNLVRQAEANNGNPFAVIRIGSRLLVSKRSFCAYLEAQCL